MIHETIDTADFIISCLRLPNKANTKVTSSALQGKNWFLSHVFQPGFLTEQACQHCFYTAFMLRQQLRSEEYRNRPVNSACIFTFPNHASHSYDDSQVFESLNWTWQFTQLGRRKIGTIIAQKQRRPWRMNGSLLKQNNILSHPFPHVWCICTSKTFPIHKAVHVQGNMVKQTLVQSRAYLYGICARKRHELHEC